ncbi:MAG: sulfotransferase [Pseudomonadota bacterium]
MAPAFLYCIGAAKAGTTWLSRALRAHPQASLPPMKETHYFDSLENGTSIWALDQLIRVRTEARKALSAADDPAARKRATRRVEDMDRWIGLVGSQRRNDALYQKLMLRGAGEKARVVADITPAYATLKQASFERMAGLNDGDTRFLMILRDPVDRLWSNISMTLARRATKGVEPNAARTALMEEVQNGTSPEMARSDYAGTLARLETAVPEDKRLVLFFEELFRPETLARLTDFMGFDSPLNGPDEKVNAGSGTRMTPQERSQLATLLRPQYEHIRNRMGWLPDRWQDTLQESMVTS